LCFSYFFLAFWPFPWQRQPFWKNQPLKFDQGISEKCVGQTFYERKKEERNIFYIDEQYEKLPGAAKNIKVS
jgi:hypothetical protein